LQAFHYKVAANLSLAQYNLLRTSFIDFDLPSSNDLASRMAFLSGLQPIKYDCCPNSCMSYTGALAEHNTCSYCAEQRYRPDGMPRRQWAYIPLIPRLVAQYANVERAKLLGSYRANREPAEDTIEDFYDGRIFKELSKRHVIINGRTLPHLYFADRRDLALGMSFDGFAPFKRRRYT
ncbi:hypothetical protein CALVIDRAFT_461997, partial [Calocera viscosa TUFC12733]